MNLFKYRKLSLSELTEIQELHRIAAAEQYKASHIKGNTALIPEGQRVSAEADAIAILMERVKNERVNQILGDLGYDSDTKCSIDLKTGKVSVLKNA